MALLQVSLTHSLVYGWLWTVHCRCSRLRRSDVWKSPQTSMSFYERTPVDAVHSCFQHCSVSDSLKTLNWERGTALSGLCVYLWVCVQGYLRNTYLNFAYYCCAGCLYQWLDFFCGSVLIRCFYIFVDDAILSCNGSYSAPCVCLLRDKHSTYI